MSELQRSVQGHPTRAVSDPATRHGHRATPVPTSSPNTDPRPGMLYIPLPGAIPDPAPFRHRYTRLCDSGTPSALAAPTDIRPIAPPRPPPRAGPGHAPRPPCTAPQRSLWYARRIPVLPCITCSCFQCFQCFHARASLYHCFLRCNSCFVVTRASFVVTRASFVVTRSILSHCCRCIS